jgi:hypothetical protein
MLSKLTTAVFVNTGDHHIRINPKVNSSAITCRKRQCDPPSTPVR